MPHIVLETSADVLENDRIPDILEGLVAELSGCESVDSASIKAYHGLRGNWIMGAGAPRGFVHCEVRLLSGRSAELRAEIAERMLGRMRSLVAESLEAGDVSLTIEVREMDNAAYRKALK